MTRSLIATATLILATTSMAGCQREAGNPAPPRIETPADLPTQGSTIVVPVSAPLSALEQRLNQATPRQLWTIDRREPRCVPEKRVTLLGARVKVLPNLGCRIVGAVTRGAIRIAGKGDTLAITLPISATIHVRDFAGVVRQKTATGAAVVRATAKLSLDRNWNPLAKVAIAYDWTDPPGIDLLGQRIRFAGKADDKLKGVIAKLERDLPRELAKMRVRDHVAGIWRQGFTSIQLNREKPPAWMRITPQRVGSGGYRIANGRIELLLAADALTETFVGNRPADPQPTPLPPLSRELGAKGLRFFIPVLADFAQLEPVVQRTLRKLAAKGITLSGVGPVDVTFGDVTIYATDGGRLAVGVRATVKSRRSMLPATRGEIWLSALPYNEPDSQVVRVRDVGIAGTTDNAAVNLLFALFADSVVQDRIRTALTHDFAHDYDKVLVAARKAVSGHREGDFLLSATVSRVSNGPLKVTGQGVFLPVQASGEADIRFAPLKKAGGGRR